MSRLEFPVGARTTPVWWHHPYKATGLLRWCLLCGKCEVAPLSAQEGQEKTASPAGGEALTSRLWYFCVF